MKICTPKGAEADHIVLKNRADICGAALYPVWPYDIFDSKICLGILFPYRRILGFRLVARCREMHWAMKLDQFRFSANSDSQIDSLPSPRNLRLNRRIRICNLD